MRKIIAQIRQRFSARSRNVCYVVIAVLVLWVGVTKELEFLERVTKTRLFFHKGYVLDTPGCRIPDYDPLHWTVRAYYHNRSGLWKRLCDESGFLVTFTNRSTPVLNERVLEWKKATAEDITCAYAEVLRNMRNPSPDNETVFGPWHELKFGRPLRGAEYIVVRCNKTGAGQIFERYAFLPRRKSGVPVLDARARRRRLNVLVLGMDSVSRISTVRHMPLTRRFLTQELNAFEFVGYNKVGFASFHNQIPLLTGIPSYIVHGLFFEMFFDSLPHLMSVYRKRGYRTLFLEEYTACGLFTYYRRFGFKKPPTDYYPRAIMQKFIRPTCSVLRYVQDLLSFDDQLLFAYLWLTDLVHGDFNGAGTLDAPLVSLLRNLSSSGVLKRTALVLVSDHGMRFGRSRRTEMGRVEDRTPTFFLALPEHFLKKHPEAAVHLQVNQRRLITPYDAHATLLTLADLPRFKPAVTDRGISVFRSISPHRTCDDASVDPEFCACDSSITTPPKPEDVRRMADATLAHINDVVRLSFPDKCVQWRLRSVEDASLTTIKGAKGQQMRFSVTLRTEPEAYFEVHGWIHNVTSSWNLHVEELDRLDEYRYQVTCLPYHQGARMMCRCKDYNGPTY